MWSGVLDSHVNATFVPRAGHGGSLLLWRAQGTALGLDEAELLIGARARTVRGHALPISEALELLRKPAPNGSAMWAGYAALARLARELLHRGSVRPMTYEARGSVSLGWRAVPDLGERTVLAAILRRMPPAGVANRPDVSPSSWAVARLFLNAAVDALIRASSVAPTLGEGTWEAAVEHALVGEKFSPPLLSTPRVRRTLEAWEHAVRSRETPRPRLVLRLEPTITGAFSLVFQVESRESSTVSGPVGVGDVWADVPEAHLLADDTGPLRKLLNEALHKAGQIVAPIEVSLAAESPTAARLTADEAWAVMSRDRAALEATGCRLALSPELEGIESRFPRAQVRLTRTDDRSIDEVSLSSKYRVVWEVVTYGLPVHPYELRAAGKQAPIARIAETWVPITAEAAERLAKVAERAPIEWTGTQALSAVLAGEVRQAGDLADAAVLGEPGLTELLKELAGEVQAIPAPVPLKATLRGYQLRGLAWLFHRTRLGLGALLADDMGLGKTVQLISLLLALREHDETRGHANDGATLLICPASLVGNWERELGRFAPSLKVLRHHGGARHKDAAELRSKAGPHDVVLTTYGLVRRDADWLGEVSWATIVCDEAQNIKNPTSAQARAVRSLTARRKIALTGTPVENRLTELWGLLEFLNPGLLGPLERFRREIALPLERDRDARALRWLRAATSPFMLRRMKTDPNIAPELPEKEIIRVFCSLTEEQAKLYKLAVDESLGSIDLADGIERSGRVLKLLTDLKQICNHPSHYLGDAESLSGRSGKLERAAEMLEEIVEGGERTLIFTQYVEMGTRLCGYLEKRLGISVPFFHGSLTLEQRDTLVRQFQEDENGPPILVLSLRAGGVGLNLTRASHVLHFDRWWNPAIEDQATDRAHRIGQKRRVQVHHLITIGTLEEKIDRMLEEKRGLADAVVSGGEAWLTQLSTDELRALVSLGSNAAVESLESWDPDESRRSA
jgi:hypothetical protein